MVGERSDGLPGAFVTEQSAVKTMKKLKNAFSTKIFIGVPASSRKHIESTANSDLFFGRECARKKKIERFQVLKFKKIISRRRDGSTAHVKSK